MAKQPVGAEKALALAANNKTDATTVIVGVKHWFKETSGRVLVYGNGSTSN